MNQKLKEQTKWKRISPFLLIMSGIMLSMLTFSIFIDSNELKSNFSPQSQASAPSLYFDGIFKIDDDQSDGTSGNGNQVIDAGEIVDIQFKIRNNYTEDVTGVNVTISSMDGNVSILEGSQHYNDISEGSIGLSGTPYRLQFSYSSVAYSIIPIDVNITANEGSWLDSFNLTVIGIPILQLQQTTITGEYDGDEEANSDGIANAGEIIDLEISLINVGSVRIENLTGYLSGNDQYMDIYDNTIYFGTLYPDFSTSKVFGIIIQGSCPDKHILNFTLNIEDGNGFANSFNFSLVVNETLIPSISISDFTIIWDFWEIEGDGDGYMEESERYQPYLTIIHHGTGNFLLEVKISSDSNCISFINTVQESIFLDISNYSYFQFSDISWQFYVNNFYSYSCNGEFSVELFINNNLVFTSWNSQNFYEATSSYEHPNSHETPIFGGVLFALVIILLAIFGFIALVIKFSKNPSYTSPGYRKESTDDIEKPLPRKNKSSISSTPKKNTNTKNTHLQTEPEESKITDRTFVYNSNDIFCPSCGKKHNQNALFCSECGVSLPKKRNLD